jgi:hypothetical protein
MKAVEHGPSGENSEEDSEDDPEDDSEDDSNNDELEFDTGGMCAIS